MNKDVLLIEKRGYKILNAFGGDFKSIIQVKQE